MMLIRELKIACALILLTGILYGQEYPEANVANEMKHTTVQEIADYLKSILPLENYLVKRDSIQYGAPGQTVKKIGVTWLPYTWTIEKAHKLNIDLLVIHETAFYNYERDKTKLFAQAVLEKQQLLDKYGIALIRCHDVWDAMDSIGIPFAWGEFLGFDKLYYSEKFYNIYEIPEQPAKQLAKHVADKIASLGQNNIMFCGDPDRIISKIGLGTGCISDPIRLYNMGADIVITVDDITRTWDIPVWCEDTGTPLIIVSHAVSEEPGMVTLTEFLAKHLKGIEVVHIPGKYPY